MFALLQWVWVRAGGADNPWAGVCLVLRRGRRASTAGRGRSGAEREQDSASQRAAGPETGGRGGGEARWTRMRRGGGVGEKQPWSVNDSSSERPGSSCRHLLFCADQGAAIPGAKDPRYSLIACVEVSCATKAQPGHTETVRHCPRRITSYCIAVHIMPSAARRRRQHSPAIVSACAAAARPPPASQPEQRARPGAELSCISRLRVRRAHSARR